MGKFMDWLRGDVVEEYGAKPDRAEAREEKKLSRWEKSFQEENKNSEAFFKAFKRAEQAVKDHVPVSAALRIIQADAGHYEIQRLVVLSPIARYGGAGRYISADKWDEMSVDPIESYRSIEDGGLVMKFNIFDEAEAYLKRMCRKTPSVAEYDFPPLKKRVVKAEPSQ